MTPQPDDHSELLNIKEAAALMKVSEASLRRWTNAGNLPCMRVGARRERRFRRSDLMAFMQSRETASAAMPKGDRPAEVVLEGISIAYGNHICTLYENDLGRVKWSVPFIRDGLRNGEGCLLVATKEVRDEILGHVSEVWDGVPGARKDGQLILSDGIPDGEAMCRFVEHSLVMATRAGMQSFRLLGDMSWCLALGMNYDDLLAYEMRYNHEVARRFPLVSVCQYDVRDFSGPAVLNALKCHEDTFNYTLSRFLAS